jgi:pimeloyl-ACP methyl ester carboxylesterase
MSAPTLYHEVHGTRGPFLLLVHGMLSSRAQWMLNLAALSADYRPVVVELFGHARSPTPDDPGAYSPENYVAEFEAVRTSLGVERWLVCGQSLGAALTLRYALDCPDRVVAQVFTNSNSALADEAWRERVVPLMAMQARRLLEVGGAALENHPLNPARGKRLPRDARDALIADYQLHTPLGIANTGQYTVPDSSVRRRATETRVPTLLVVGERETGFAEARTYAERTIPGLHVTALDAGHAVNLEAADGFNEAVTRFYAGHAAGETEERTTGAGREG